MGSSAAQYDVRIDSTCSLFFAERPEAPKLGSLGHPSAKAIGAVMEARHKVTPEVEERIKEHIYQYESPAGRTNGAIGACCCCWMPCFVDQTQAWDMERDTDKVKRQVVAILAEVMRPDEYDLIESVGMPSKRMFDPASGGLQLLRLYVKPQAASSSSAAVPGVPVVM